MFRRTFRSSVEFKKLFVFRVPPFFGAFPNQGGVEGDPINPGAFLRVTPERRQGTPELQGDVLQQILSILRRRCESAHDFPEQASVVREPSAKNCFVFLQTQFQEIVIGPDDFLQ